MKNNVYKVISLILAFIVTILGILLIKANKNDVVAKVNGKKIYESDVQKELSTSSYKMALNSLINMELIDIAFNDNGYTVTDEDRENYLDDVEYFDHNKNSLKDKETYDFVTNYVKVRKLTEKYSLSDEELNKFIESEIDHYGNKVITVKAIYGSEDQIKEMNSLNSTERINEYVKSNALETVGKKVFSEMNYFAMDFSKAAVNNVYVYQGNGEIDEDIYSNRKALVVVEQIDDALDSTLNINKNRDEIVDSYISKNYFKARLNLLNVLRGNYEVEKAK